MRLGQVEQLFDASSQAHSEQFPAPERNQRVRQLVAPSERIRPGVHEAEDTVAAIRRHNDQDGECRDQHDNQDGKQPGTHAAQE